MTEPLELNDIFLRLGISAGLGLLVGLQRERVRSELAGIRTFALITVLGTVLALMDRALEGSLVLVAVGAAAVAGLLVVGNLMQRRSRKKRDPGLTTEVAALLMYGVGAYLAVGHVAIAIAVGGGAWLLLYFKAPMHEFVARIGEADLRAIMQFVLVALVVLPVLPNETYGPYQVLNPHQIWMMVVLIVGLNLVGYVAYKLFGQDAGALVGGALGGMVSSTATTVTYSRQARQAPERSGLAAVVLLIATAISYGRVLTEIAVVAPARFVLLAGPLAIMLALFVVLAAGLFLLVRNPEGGQAIEAQNPAELKAALLFGGLYAVVLLAIAAARDQVGESGLYGVAILSGLHDVDAITLSTARLVQHDQLAADVGWRVILTATLSNLVMKWAIAAALGHRRLALWVGGLFGLAFAVGIVLALVWPDLGSQAVSPAVAQ